METFEQIYSSYLKDVYKYIFSLCHDPAEAEEITQEAFFQAMKSMPSFRGECKLIVWLCQIAKHIYFARLNKKKRAAPPPEELFAQVSDSGGPSMEQRLLDEADAMAIHRHLHDLEEPYKEVFMLRIFGELSFKKIADLFGKTEGWARTTYHRAKIKIMDELERERLADTKGQSTVMDAKTSCRKEPETEPKNIPQQKSGDRTGMEV